MLADSISDAVASLRKDLKCYSKKPFKYSKIILSEAEESINKLDLIRIKIDKSKMEETSKPVIDKKCKCGGEFKYKKKEGYVCQGCGKTRIFPK